jgi:sortase A
MYFSKLIFSILLIIIASIIYTPKDFKDSIEIPSINLVENIVFGYSNSVLKQGVLLDPNSLKNTNWIVYGHRFVNLQPFRKYFRDLDKVEIGDSIYLTIKEEKLIFKVVNILTVSPKDTWVLSSNIDRQLTLITCTPLLNPINRLVVISNLVSEQ